MDITWFIMFVRVGGADENALRFLIQNIKKKRNLIIWGWIEGCLEQK